MATYEKRETAVLPDNSTYSVDMTSNQAGNDFSNYAVEPGSPSDYVPTSDEFHFVTTNHPNANQNLSYTHNAAPNNQSLSAHDKVSGQSRSKSV